MVDSACRPARDDIRLPTVAPRLEAVLRPADLDAILRRVELRNIRPLFADAELVRLELFLVDALFFIRNYIGKTREARDLLQSGIRLPFKFLILILILI